MPLKVESIVPQGNMIMEVVDIKRESLSSSLFTIPSDYKETQGMFGGVRWKKKKPVIVPVFLFLQQLWAFGQ